VRPPSGDVATDTLKAYEQKGYISKDVAGMKAEDAGTAFIAGKYPMFVSGSWWYGRFASEIKGYDWGIFPFPGSKLSLGSSGNLWVVPENSKNKDLAEKFIDITMSPEIQAIIGNNGGVPVAANASDITDAKSTELISAFTDITKQDGLSFYPDWPTPTFYDTLVAQFVHLSDSMNAANRAQRSAALAAVILPLQIVRTVLLERDTRMPSLLRTPVHETVLADIEISRAGAAVPFIGHAVREVLLEAVVVREVEQRLAECDDALPTEPLPFQCTPPTKAFTYRDFRKR